MKNILVILALLVVPYAALAPLKVSPSLRGRIGISLVFAFTGVGHFVKTAEMTAMLPPAIPMRTTLIYVTGLLELLAAAAVLSASWHRPVGIALCVFLVLVLPANIYAALERIDFGGHADGPAYLLLRVPLQVLIVGWIYWFAVRGPAPKLEKNLPTADRARPDPHTR